MPDWRPSEGDRADDRYSTDQVVLSTALEGMLSETGAHSGAVYLLAPDEPVLVMAVMTGLPREFAAPWERVGLAAPIPVADALRERRLVWVSGEEDMVSRYPRVALVLPYPFALAALPIVTADEAYGAVFLTWPGSRPARLSAQERDRLTAACDRLALRLAHSTRTGRPMRSRPEPQPEERTPSSGDSVSQAAEAAETIARLPEGICALDPQGRIVFISQGGADMVGLPVRRLLGARPWVVLPWLHDPVYEDRYRAALISQQPTSFVALRPPHDWLSFHLYPSRTGISVRITPARVVGTDRTRSTTLQEPRTAAVPSLGALSHILHLASALTEAAGVRDVISLVAEQIMPAFGIQGLNMMVAEGGRLRILGHRGYPPGTIERFEGISVASATPGAQALATGVPAFFESSAELERVYPDNSRPQDGMGAWAFLPLIASGRPVGTCVFAYTGPHHFSADERAVLTSLGGLIAQALERARLYDAKYRLAHGLQEALLPHTLPRLPGLEVAARYLPGTRGMDIGGDFYDLVGLGPGTSAAVIGDVQGHNVTAAALMGQVRTAVRAYTAVGQRPDGVLRSTNQLLADLDSDLFTSCLYAHLDLRRSTIRVARAGHPQPLLRRPDGRVDVLDVPGGLLLGIDRAAHYPTVEIPLPPGSVLALYTDGLIESPETDMDHALADLAGHLSRSGEQPLERLAENLVGHAHRTHQRTDDVALLLLRPTGTWRPGPPGGDRNRTAGAGA